MIERASGAASLFLLFATAAAGIAAADAPAVPAAAAAVATTQAQPAPAAAMAAAVYPLQPGDVIEISVWNEDDLKRQVLIRPDGGLSFPLAGDLVAAGLTPADLQHEIETRLAKFIPDAVVTVSVMQINGQVYVVGKVNKPGAYKFDRALDVMQALSLAGGATEFAGVDAIKILRRTADGRQQVFPFDYTEVARGRRLDENIVLQSGDTLVVP
jgi:polysaccharide biosynthesis/export protein